MIDFIRWLFSIETTDRIANAGILAVIVVGYPAFVVALTHWFWFRDRDDPFRPPEKPKSPRYKSAYVLANSNSEAMTHASTPKFNEPFSAQYPEYVCHAVHVRREFHSRREDIYFVEAFFMHKDELAKLMLPVEPIGVA